MKQGRTEKAVFAKLSTEKVELSIINDIDKINNDIDSISKEAGNIYNKAVSNVFANFNSASRLESSFDKLISKFEANIKELGLDPNSSNFGKELKSKKKYFIDRLSFIKDLKNKLS
tara:strand:- start:691 stop:1038 length:348 start_codon:yes stop_codon:yes gene_type:complete